MSQSDYLTYKKNKHVLIEQTKLPSVLSHKAYLQYLNYQLVNTITNTKPMLNNLSFPESHSFFVVPINSSIQPNTCPAFIECKNTNSRPNRKNNSCTQMFSWKPLPYQKDIPYCCTHCKYITACHNTNQE